MKTTIFTRILLATLLPVFLVLLIVIGTTHSVIYADGTAYAEDFLRLAAKQVSQQTAVKLDSATGLQRSIAAQMADINFHTADARQTANGLLDTLFFSNHDLYFAWFAFEPNIFPEGDRPYRLLQRDEGGIREADDLGYGIDMLGKPELSAWYTLPLSTGEAYTDISYHYDFISGEALPRLFVTTYPIRAPDGEVIGCLGLSIRYQDLFPVSVLDDGTMRRVMLVSTLGDILYSSDHAETDGGKLWGRGFADPAAVSQALADKEVWQEEIRSSATGEKLLVCLYPVEIGRTQMIYLCGDTPVSSLYSVFYSSLEIILITGALGMALLAFCVFFSTRGMVGNVKRITDSFYHVANNTASLTLSGEHIPVHQTNIRELDILQSALVSMMIQLRKAHEVQLKTMEVHLEKEKLVASSQAKINFFATMSHEIRTPMNAILGISEILLLEGNLTPSQDRYVQDIKISSDSLLSIINDILDISKLESGKMALHPEHYNFRALIDNIVSLSMHLASEANLQFYFKANGELPLCLYGDGTRLRQVLLNLIGNAVKFTREGYVMLRIFLQEEESIRFDVVDTGIGIKNNELGTIFETFKRIDTRRNREVRGTGLGLSISENLVTLMGGTISVDSVYSKGSTFSVTIPLVPGENDKLRRVKPGEDARYADSLRVLIVDDNEINLNVSSGLLRAAHGIHCDTAGSGQEAIVRIQEIDYDIIFMDHMMPELDGVDTTQYIRQLDGKFKTIPIIALTANAVIGTRKELMDGGMDDFLAKPIQSGELQQILNTWVPEEKRLPASPADSPAPHAAWEDLAEPKSLSTPSLRNLLESACIDTLAGMENIGFDEEMYLQSLRLLRDKLPSTIQSMDDLLREQNVWNFYVVVHGLKGSLISVGAAALSDDAKRLELAAMEENLPYCRAQLPALREKLRRLHQTLCKTLPDEEAPPALAVLLDKEQLADNLQSLCAALENYDYEAINSALDAIAAGDFGPEMSKALSQAKLSIQTFDYPRAIALLREAMESA